jgi:hypothetical protein
VAGRECKDDPSIADHSLRLRRIPAAWVVQDSVDRGLRPSSGAFGAHPDGSPMSVVLAEVLENAGRPLSDALAAHEGFALVAFSAGDARSCGQGVERDPTPEEPAHGLVCGTKTKAVKRRLAKASRWAVGPLTIGGHK